MIDPATDYPKVRALSASIIEIDYGPNGQVTLEAIRSAHLRHKALGLEGRQGVLVRADDVIRADQDAERFCASQAVQDVTLAVAIVAKSFVARHLGRMYMWMFKPPYPSRLFADSDEALRWLEFMVDKIRSRETQ